MQNIFCAVWAAVVKCYEREMPKFNQFSEMYIGRMSIKRA